MTDAPVGDLSRGVNKPGTSGRAVCVSEFMFIRPCPRFNLHESTPTKKTLREGAKRSPAETMAVTLLSVASE